MVAVPSSVGGVGSAGRGGSRGFKRTHILERSLYLVAYFPSIKRVIIKNSCMQYA